MKTLSPLPTIFLAVALTAPCVRAEQIPSQGDRGQAGQVLDEIVAVVNGSAITQSEVELASAFEDLSTQLSQTSTPRRTTLTAARRDTTLQHLIDQRLLMDARDNEGYDIAGEESVSSQWAHLAKVAGSEQTLRAKMNALHLSEEDVRSLLREQLTIVAFLDQHLSNIVSVTPDDVQHYYDTVFVPEARQKSITPAPLSTVRDSIQEILTNQRMDTAQQQWIETLRNSADIEILPAGKDS